MKKMKKQLLKERFQQLAGVKPLYELTTNDTCTEFIQVMSPSAAGLWTPGTQYQGTVPVGDIDCCQMLIGNFVGPYGDSANQNTLQGLCTQEWQNIVGPTPISSPGTLPWKRCCPEQDTHDKVDRRR